MANNDDQPNRISAVLDEGTLQSIRRIVLDLRDKFHFLDEYMAGERQYVLEVSKNLRPFIDQSLKDARVNEEICPPGLDLDELERDLRLYDQLSAVIKPLDELLEQLTEIRMAAGSDAFETAMTFYKTVRMEAELGDQQATAVLNDLREHLPSYRRRL